MSDLATKSQPAVKKLLQNDEDTLYEQLGMRSVAMTEDPALASSFDLAGLDPSQTAGIGESLDRLRNLGKRIFNRWNLEAYKLICGGDPDDQKQREEVAKSFGLGDAAIAGAITALLISSFGLAPAIATVIASIIVTRFVRGAYEEFCAAWKEGLPRPAGT